jgi:phosphatidylinositol glycan class B
MAENDRVGLAVLVAVLALGAALRAWLSFNDDGIYWPDEIYQSVEPGHRLVFGYGLIPWEFIEGARTWALPGLVAALLKLCAIVGLDDPRQYLSVVRLAFSTIGVATAFGSYRLARRLGATSVFAACGAAFFALSAPAIYFAPRALAETASALPIVFGLACALKPSADRRDHIIGASLLGLATLLRLQNALFCAGLLAVLAARRQWTEVRAAAVVFAVWAGLLGLLDRLTWGSWFRSAEIYVRLNLILGAEPVTGTSPAPYYLDMLFRSMPIAAIAVAVLCAIAVPRARGLAFVALSFFAVHMLIPNKAYRYILPVLPLLGALAALGLQAIWTSGHRDLAAWAALGLLVAVLSSAVHFHGLTFGEVGPYEKTRPTASAYDDRGPVNRLLIAAGRRPDLCGLKVETDHLAWLGGYSYLHRDVPLYPPTGPAQESGQYNYVIAARGRQETGIVVAADGDRVLWRLGTGGCTPNRAFDPRLPGADEVRRLLGS